MNGNARNGGSDGNLPTDRLRSDNNVQIDELVNEIRRNRWGCDLMICFFVSALQSYRADRCLRPFPTFYVDNNEKNFSTLRLLCDTIPPLSSLITDPKKCSVEVYSLLTWLLERHLTLKRVASKDVPFPSTVDDFFKPQFLYEVCYDGKVEDAWLKRRSDKETMFAYHGSSLDNFYSIVKVGLQQHFSVGKDVLFGNGIYLSTEVSLSAHYAPFGQTWGNSGLGNRLSVIAICEIIDDVEKVKCRDATDKTRSVNVNSVGEIPEKYFVVTDSDMVRVKYLMVYRNKSGFSLKCCIVNNWWVIILVVVVIGVFCNTAYLKHFKKILQALGFE